MIDVGLLVAKHCDVYVHSIIPNYKHDTLQCIVKDSRCSKARLLHYFDISSSSNHSSDEDNNNLNNDETFSSWCGWHNDHCALTGLTSAMYMLNDQEVSANEIPSTSDSGKLSLYTNAIPYTYF